ncbi:hypothetical protein CDAR_50921 [Caerostris darwini]|uniref:Uncharacterized protein n=1 Tax=Caerostris darwini TaxID=1538125 RepID=A0AAV4U5M9_9ARAC|nr:hypothetical protein CDAR_50921 [Caerostris darwini]
MGTIHAAITIECSNGREICVLIPGRGKGGKKEQETKQNENGEFPSSWRYFDYQRMASLCHFVGRKATKEETRPENLILFSEFLSRRYFKLNLDASY